MNTKIGGDLLDGHTIIAVTSNPHDIVAELTGLGPGHTDILSAHPSGQANSDVTYSCSRPVCGACKLACEAGAIYYETDLPDDQQQHLADNTAFFIETLPGRDGSLGSPGGADRLGPVGVDTPLIAAMAARGD
jgi:ferredoxin